MARTALVQASFQEVLVIVEHLKECGFKSAVELPLLGLEPMHLLADQRVSS
jgi:hypothetical protein